MALAARDRKAVLTLVEQAQIVFLLTRYPKKQVLDDAGDVERLEKGLDGMRAAAKEVSRSIREAHAAVPWDEIAKEPDSADLAWRKGKRVAPTVLRELLPLLEGAPEAAFFLRPEPAKKSRTTSGRSAPTRSARAAPRRGRAGRSS